MARFLKLSKLKNIFAPSTLAIEASTGAKYQDEGSHKRVDSSEIFVLKMLCNIGPMSLKDMWSEYQRQAEIAKAESRQFTEYFQSKNYLRDRVLEWMLVNKKIRSKGYNKVGKVHLGWEVNEERAFKNLHPDLKEDLREALKELRVREAEKLKEEQEVRGEWVKQGDAIEFVASKQAKEAK